MASAASASELARRLANNAEAVCRHFLPAGRKEGRYWLVGNARGEPGRSLYVRLTGPDYGKGAAGKWTDAASFEHGDLLDLIALTRGLPCLRDAMDEARAFLRLPLPQAPSPARIHETRSLQSSSVSARKLFAMSQSIAGTAAELYLRQRGIDPRIVDVSALRFHPRCFYRDADSVPTKTLPALIAGVTDNDGGITGVQRTWLDPFKAGVRADVKTPRRAMGALLGFGVRFGMSRETPFPILAAGEGLETLMSLRMAMPGLPMIAGLSANHLAALNLPPTLGRLYIAVDADPAGRRAMERLSRRARNTGIEVLTLLPRLGDFNEDLRRLGLKCLVAQLRDQLLAQDAARFLRAS